MSLLSVYQLKANAEFKSRVASAVAKAAYDILNESVDIPNHDKRVASKTAMKDAALVAEQMMWTIVQNATIQSKGTNSTDNDIQFVVNSNIDYFAV